MNAERRGGDATLDGRAASGPSVLVVDDEEVVRAFLVRCLEKAGYRVKQAGSAAEALEMMVGAPAGAVLCDIRMPGQDGLWLMERLRSHWPGTPIVVTTAIDDVDTVRRARELGAVDYVTKPINAGQLLEILSRVAGAPADDTGHEEGAVSDAEPHPQGDQKVEAEYTLESPVRCPACGERIASLKAIRLARTHVNFTSTLPRRGRVLACPNCLALVPAELTNF